MKKSYVKPVLTVHGSVEKITQQTTTGLVSDAAFPSGTPLTQITVS